MHPILHVVVVGFHHSKGCTIEYSYPPLQSPSDDIEANLPSLAMPDGSHNTANGDTVYFLLPALEDNRAVFGVACYRQIATDSLLSKDEGVTRSYVQKSVCVLSKIPLYGVLTAKLELITQAYFNEKDFSKVEVLQKMYESLCEIFDYSSLESSSLYMGIPLSSLFNAFGHRTLELFKIVLLERRVVFEIHPTSLLGDIIIGLVSLFPCKFTKMY
jgi:hypothetical protein